MSDKVLKDSQVTGGNNLRSVDHKMSETFGGYRVGGNGIYANYVEPVLHAAEHSRRALFNSNGAEFARAKDELKSFGKGGLSQMENTYQNQYKK